MARYILVRGGRSGVQSSCWALQLLRSLLMHTDVTCSLDQARKEGKQQVLPWTAIAILSVGPRVTCQCISTLFAQFPATVGNFKDFFYQDVKLMNQNQTSFNLISLLVSLNSSFGMEQFLITWLTLTLYLSRIHTINSHNKAYFKYIFNPLRKPISSLNVPLIYSK